jgi:benzoyl-CoA-dihydrodiol lyase
MAEAERKLSNGRSRIDFQTDPSKYRHWKLEVDGEMATLLLDVDENGGLFEGYDLKLNSTTSASTSSSPTPSSGCASSTRG